MGEHVQLRLSELLAALSVVTDLGIGRPPETAMGACLLATGLAARMGLRGSELSDVYYATLLRYIGCTAYAHEEARLAGGDELAARAVTTRTDYRNGREALSTHLRLAPAAPPARRAAVALTSLPRMILANRELVAAHCEVGVAIARRLDMSPPVQAALDQIFERWDGKGYPRGLKGDALSLPIRFAHLATQVMAFLPDGDEAVDAIVQQRAGGWFDPTIVAAFRARGRSLLAEVQAADTWTAAVACEPEPHRLVGEQRLDAVASAFADLADLKTPYTSGHSPRVAAFAEEGARRVRLGEPEVTQVRRAGLLHDIGRVGVPDGVWEKKGPLTAIEWEKVRLHAYHSERILARAPALAAIAPLAGMHHERLDGSGYHRGIAGAAIPIAARLLAAADAYEAMTRERPYRPALDGAGAAGALEVEVRAGRLDAEATRAVLEAAGHRLPRPRQAGPAGLSEREIEVLGLIARGASYRDVARVLVISPRTAAHHVQHIYNKIGVSTRAGATLFAMEHRLL